ncbi:F-box/kelch-repeat protein At3g23880-like [Lotus japonicus]|uniref:F-box/kelch-repeat protein At3g23880-like n=1 Tax=Lotus japonicus TaxID=34305 RepID=UPI00258A463E|nr:F-box/kelch-repeat protein At3g23880-like [Lotus japonicus]
MLQRLRFCFSRPVADAEPPPPPPPPPLIHIPDELILEILLWLPVKSLVRFTCVCKSWKFIISDPQFVKLHLDRSSDYSSADLTHIKLLSASKITLYDGPYYRIEPHVSVYSLPLLFSSQKGDFYKINIDYQLVGVCNGLVSFIKWNYFYSENISSSSCWVRFWNPATRLWSKMSPPLSLLRIPWHENFGFGYDSLNDSYKMVVILDVRDSLQDPKHNVVNVYDMGGSYWRSIRSSPDLPTSLWPMPTRNGVYLSSTLNWLVLVNTDTLIIFSLNLVREEYSHLSLPPPSQHVEDLRPPPILEALKDSLCILQSDGKEGFVVWQMKEFGDQESWIKLFNFCFEEDLIHMVPSFSPIQFILSKNNEILLISPHELVLYKHIDKTFKFTSRVPQHQSSYPCIFHNYVESLVSPL